MNWREHQAHYWRKVWDAFCELCRVAPFTTAIWILGAIYTAYFLITNIFPELKQ